MKNKLCLLLFLLPIMLSAETQKPESIDVTQKVSVDNFLKIKKFVLDQKKIALHGSLYGDSPFYKINNNISLFVVCHGFEQIKESGNSDSLCYIEIRHSFRDKKDNYISSIDLQKKENNILLIPYWDSQETMQTKVLLLDKILPQILDTIK